MDNPVSNPFSQYGVNGPTVRWVSLLQLILLYQGIHNGLWYSNMTVEPFNANSPILFQRFPKRTLHLKRHIQSANIIV